MVVLYFCVCMCAYVRGWCVCRDLHDTLGQTSWCDKRWTSSIANVFLWKDSVSDITVTVYPFLFVFCDLCLSLYNWDWGPEPECPVTPGQEVEVGHYKHSCSALTSYIWHSVFIGVRPRFAYSFYPQPFSHSLFLPHQLPSSTFSLPQPTPSFLCLLLLP